MRRIFLNTEFTKSRNGLLHSVCLVTDDGQELHVDVADPTRHAQASVFCRHSAAAQCGLVPGSSVRDDAEVGAQVADWLSSFEHPVAIAYDYRLFPEDRAGRQAARVM